MFLRRFTLIAGICGIAALTGCAGSRTSSPGAEAPLQQQDLNAQIPSAQYQPDAEPPSPEEMPSDREVPSARRGAFPHTQFDWPVDEARLTRGYFLKDPKGRRRRPHLGIDLAAPKGTPILASQDGTVIYSGREFRGFGRMVMIESPGGWATLYAHLTKSLVKEGQKVRQGDMIALMGRSGRATGVHLHFEIRQKTGPVDPLQYLPRASRFAQTKSP